MKQSSMNQNTKELILQRKTKMPPIEKHLKKSQTYPSQNLIIHPIDPLSINHQNQNHQKKDKLKRKRKTFPSLLH